MNDDIIIDVAYFAEDPEITRGLLRASKARAEKLRRAYLIPGYENLPYTEKLAIYDKISAEVNKEYGV